MFNKAIEENIEYPIILLNLSRDGIGTYLIGLYKKDEDSVRDFIIRIDGHSDKIKIIKENNAKVVYKIKNYKVGSPTYELIEVYVPENYMFK